MTTERTGRQDFNAPEFDLEESEPIPNQVRRGQRLWLWIALVGVIFAVVIIITIVAFN